MGTTALVSVQAILPGKNLLNAGINKYSIFNPRHIAGIKGPMKGNTIITIST